MCGVTYGFGSQGHRRVGGLSPASASTLPSRLARPAKEPAMIDELLYNFAHNLFKPLLLFFYAGFAIPLLRVKFEFPKVLYQSLTIYLLLAIGWHGGEELASLSPDMIGQAVGFTLLGFCTNLVLGFVAYWMLRKMTRLRKIDAATVAGYYGSDSAGTFVTCLGMLAAANIAFAPYMPMLLAVMEIPGCLVALYLVSRLRRQGMDETGNMPGEAGYVAARAMTQNEMLEWVAERQARTHTTEADDVLEEIDDALHEDTQADWQDELVAVGAHVGSYETHSSGTTATITRRAVHRYRGGGDDAHADSQRHVPPAPSAGLPSAEEPHEQPKSGLSKELLHEVFLNPGIFLLFAGITIGFVSRLQGEKVTLAGDVLFTNLFQGILCLFLLEMGMTASQKLKDLRTAGWRFISFGLLAPNLFAVTGICAAHTYSLVLGQPLELGTYALFAVLCGAASYIALPAVQSLAIPEASPTLPLASALGVTFTYNVTIGIPVYVLVAKTLTTVMPVG